MLSLKSIASRVHAVASVRRAARLTAKRSVHDRLSFLEKPNAARVSWLPNVVSDVLPFAIEVISSRNGLDNSQIAVGYSPQLPPEADPNNPMGTRRVDDSWVEMILPFSEYEPLRQVMMKTDQKSVRYGKLFEVLDAFAADIAYRHCGGRKERTLTIVTASVDQFKLYGEITVEHDLRLLGYLSYIGKSSMEVTIDLISTPSDGQSEPIFLGTTHFVMVARKDKAAAAVSGLRITNPKYQAIFEEGKARAAQRRLWSSKSFEHSPPLPEEISLIHDLHLEGQRLLQKEHSTTTVTNEASSTPLAAPTSAEDGEPRVWLSSTVFRNTQFMHPQERNIHGKIFGGFIMRNAFELAYITAVCFLGVNNAVFSFVHDIQFVRPVSVGSITEFSAAVVFSHDGYIVVQVVATDVSPNSRKRTRTNLFSYVFHTREKADGTFTNTPRVVPLTYEEVLMYLEGRRSLRQLLEGVCEVRPASQLMQAESSNQA